ncbi:exo-alpha-sialidase [Streptomyces sp. NPDC020965]|uniref:exo-alpha-sialidase n=1 Tax=Streptomyces sp. NPDC020965 TaxID=3365105 RepID=UPI003795B694
MSTPFTHHTEGYACFRIPALITTTSGALLVFAEGRVDDCSDIGHIDIVMKRSLDGGRTWGPLSVLSGAGDTLAHGNPAPVADSATGRISLLYASGPWSVGADVTRVRGPRALHALSSTDDGVNWRTRGPLSHLKPAGWTWVSTGPGHGIQLAGGPHRGRLVIPGDHTTDDAQGGGQLYYSDDGGLNWTLGAVHRVPRTSAYPSEPTVAERRDGSLYVNARSSATCGTDDHRMTATSTDGGLSFATPFTPVPSLETPPVFGSLLRMPSSGPNRPRLLLSAPSRPGAHTVEDRRTLAVRSSFDEGRTWQSAGTVVDPGRAGYSDLTLLPSGAISLAYETATNTPHGTIRFTSFTETHMDTEREELRLPRTSDSTGNSNHAVVHGKAVLGNRGSGKAIELDGQDDYIRLVNCAPSLRLGGGDFTVTAWFRHTETSRPQPIVWGYGQGAGARQFWLRAEPGSGTVRAAIDTGTASASVETPSSYNDGAWHHVVFQRQGSRLHLSVDGGPVRTTAAPPGDITPPGAFTIHLGARPDYEQLFRGGLDDIRIHGRALTPAEYARVRDGAVDVAVEEERVRLGFTTLW